MNYSVIFHVDETAKWELTLKNVVNLLDQAGDTTFCVEVLANGEAVQGYVLPKNPFAAAMQKLDARGALFAACNNSLNALKIDRSSLISFVKVVPAGVLELVERQAEGYAYIKP